MKPINQVLFIDIETVPLTEKFGDLPQPLQEQWLLKSVYLKNEEGLSAESLYEQRGGIYSEFGKVICIGMGYFRDKEEGAEMRIMNIYGKDEVAVLEEFSKILSKFGQEISLCAHNGKEFDFPFLSRRIMIQQLSLPYQLSVSGKKPWETSFIDTMDLWRFGDYKNYTSLELISTVLNIPSSKSDISGKDISRVYYKEDDLERIVRYCNQDVLVTARVYAHLSGSQKIKDDEVIFLESDEAGEDLA